MQKQEEQLIEKRWVQESLSPYVMPVILVPKKNNHGEYVVTAEPSTISL